MTRIGALHARSLIATAALGPIGVITGSAVLLVACSAALISLIYGANELHEVARSLTKRRVVHVATVLLLALTLIFVKRVGIDAVFLVLMLGIVNKVRGDWTQARKHFTVAEKLDPTGEHGAKAKEHLRQMSRRSDEPVSSDDGE